MQDSFARHFAATADLEDKQLDKGGPADWRQANFVRLASIAPEFGARWPARSAPGSPARRPHRWERTNRTGNWDLSAYHLNPSLLSQPNSHGSSSSTSPGSSSSSCSLLLSKGFSVPRRADHLCLVLSKLFIHRPLQHDQYLQVGFEEVIGALRRLLLVASDSVLMPGRLGLGWQIRGDISGVISG
jgi:hypothetical protein